MRQREFAQRRQSWEEAEKITHRLQLMVTVKTEGNSWSRATGGGSKRGREDDGDFFLLFRLYPTFP
jgi:hypothetical protein